MFLDCLKSLSAVTNLAFLMIDVAAIILSAGSLLAPRPNVEESSAISGVIPYKRKRPLNDSGRYSCNHLGCFETRYAF